MPAEVQHRAKECKQLEKVVDEGINTFITVGNALRKLRDDRYYKDRGFKTFEAYVLKRFEFTRQRAYQLIGSARAATVLSTVVDKTPLLERQARVVSDVKDDRQIAKIAGKAAEKAGKKPLTAKHLQEAKDEVIPPEPKPGRDYRKEARAALGTLIRALDELKLSEETFHQGPAATPLEALDAIKYMVSGEM